MTTAKRDTYTPETLLSVAVRVFNERGYDGTSMEHLSKAAGISKSSIYHHVTGKEELLRRAVSRALDGLFGILDEEHARVGRAVERLEYVTRRMVEVLTAELPYVTLLLRVRGNTDTERWALERRREFDHQVAELLKAAAADGDVRGRRGGPARDPAGLRDDQLDRGVVPPRRPGHGRARGRRRGGAAGLRGAPAGGLTGPSKGFSEACEVPRRPSGRPWTGQVTPAAPGPPPRTPAASVC